MPDGKAGIIIDPKHLERVKMRYLPIIPQPSEGSEASPVGSEESEGSGRNDGGTQLLSREIIGSDYPSAITVPWKKES